MEVAGLREGGLVILFLKVSLKTRLLGGDCDSMDFCWEDAVLSGPIAWKMTGLAIVEIHS